MTTAHSTSPTPPRSSAPRSMGASAILFTRQTWAGARVLAAMTLLLGVAYPLAVTGLGQVAFPWQANGSLLTASGERATSLGDDVVGSALIGQGFDADTWFHPRPSAAGEGYDTLASAGSNLGPNNADLLATVKDRRKTVAEQESVNPVQVPPDALTASASGLDPDISPAYARLQVERVAQARGVSVDQVTALVAAATSGRTLGLLGEPRVNVLRLNLALETMAP